MRPRRAASLSSGLPAGAVHLMGLATALPSRRVSQAEALRFLLRRFPPSANRAFLGRVFRHPSVMERRFALKNLNLLATETLEGAHARFAREATGLAVRALRGALREARTSPRRLDFIAVATCTASLCPGLSSHVAEAAGLRSDAARLDVAGMGCGAALPALEAARDFLSSHPGARAAAVCAELGSAAFFPGDDRALIVSNALFGDGAAAVVLGATGRGPRLSRFAALHVPAWREELRFRWEKGRLRNVLAPTIPARAAETIGSLMDRLRPGPVDHWALHPGGAKVLDALRDRLRISEAALAPARAVLRRVGNLSSPSCLFVLEEIMKRPPRRGERAVLAAFGAGFSAHAALLEF